MSAEYLDQVKEHLSNGLAIIDLAGHVDEPGALWRRDSLAYAMQLVFKEWQAAHVLLSRLEDERPGEQRHEGVRPRGALEHLGGWETEGGGNPQAQRVGGLQGED